MISHDPHTCCFRRTCIMKKCYIKTQQSHFNRYSYNLMIFIIWLISGRGIIVPDFSFQKVEAMVASVIVSVESSSYTGSCT